MTLRFLSLVSAMVLSSTVAIGEPLLVTAGDHATFTRLVVPLPSANTSWELIPSNRKYQLEISAQSIQFDLSGVFRKISRARLKKVSVPRTATLELLLECDCKISTFIWQKQNLIIDITDQPNNKKRGALSVFAIEPGLGISQSLSSAYSPGQNTALAKKPKPLTTFQIRPTKAPTNLQKIEGGPSTNSRKTEKKALFEGVLKATSQGLLNPRVLPTQKNADTIRNKNPALDLLDLAANLEIQSSVDRDLSQPHLKTNQNQADQCIASSSLDIASWSNGEAFDKQIAMARQSLISDLQSPDPHAILHLARVYLHFGFGAEARASLELLKHAFSDIKVLHAIAAVLDNDVYDEPNPFAHLQNCKNASAMWAILSNAGSDQTQSVNSTAILNAYLDLPKELKSLLSHRLSEALIAANEVNAAQQVLHILDRVDAKRSTESQLAQANIQIENDSPDQAVKLLEQIVDDKTESTPQALANLIETQFSRRQPISARQTADVGAYAIEFRFQKLGQNLRRAHLLAQTSNQNFSASLETLSEIQERDSTGDWKDLLQIVTEEIVQNAPDDRFLKSVFSHILPNTKHLQPTTNNAVAHRLFNLGFIDQANQLASRGADGAIGRERRIIRAQISLANNRPRQTEAHLLGLNGTDVESLRAKAKAIAGDTKKAMSIHSNLGNEEAAQQLAWKSGDWQYLAESEEADYSDISQLMLAEDSVSGEEISLKLSRSLLAGSQQTRETIADLLRNHQFETALASNIE